jgi:peptide/nickel transport system substrate-binding protein
MSAKKSSALFALVMVLSLILAACAPAAAPQPATAVVEKVIETVIVEGTPQVIEKVVTPTPAAVVPTGTVVVGVWQEPKGLIWNIYYDAHANDILDSMYLTPVALDANDELVPEMLTEIPTVENGGVSADGLTYTLKFREGLKWEDGQPVTADDFKFTWQFIMDPNTKSQTSIGWDQIASVEVSDPQTAVVTLEQSYVPFVAAVLAFPIMPKHVLEGVADPGNSEFARKPVGNGPFMFQEWISGDHITVVANPNADVQPKIEKIIFKFVPDMNSLLAMLRTGDIDVAYDMRELQVPEVLKMSGITPYVIPGVNVERYYFNQRDPQDLSKPHPIFADVNVRKAVAMAMDRPTAVASVLQGYGEVAVSELDNHPWFNTDLEPIPYDPEAAKALLDEAGWVDSNGDGVREKDGVKLAFRHSTTAGNQSRENLQVLFQQNLKDIGAEMEIVNYPAATLFGGCADNGIIGSADFDILGFANKPASLDLVQEWADFFLTAAIKNCETNPAGTNAWGYSNPDADAALQCAMSEVDPAKRLACIMDGQQIIYDDYPVVYVYDRLDVYAATKNLGGFNPTVFGSWSWNFADWYLVE